MPPILNVVVAMCGTESEVLRMSVSPSGTLMYGGAIAI